MHASIVFLNGKFLPENEAVIPVSDRGFLFGDGIFTTIKVDQGHPQFLAQHLKKFEEDCNAIGIVPQKVSEEMIIKLIESNRAVEGVWRLKLLMTGGSDPGIGLERRQAGQFLMTIKPYAVQVSTSRLVSYPYPVSYPLGRFKSLSYMDRLWLADYAFKRGFDDALVHDEAGRVLETSIANIFWRIGKDLFFPDSSLLFYHGVTLHMILLAAESLGMVLYPMRAKLDEISDNAQFYLCNSLKGIVPVTAINEKSYSRDLLFEETLQKAFP